MTVEKKQAPLTDSDRIELEQLRARFNREVKEAPVAIAMEESVERADEPIRQDEYIPVMSLLPYNLNLSTKEGGQGSIKKFTRFGEVKKILYKDLVDIMEVHPTFMESGYFYILDPRFIRQMGLDEMYSKILTKEKMELMLEANSEQAVTLYKSANSSQQEVLIQILIEKVRNNPESVNLNIIDKISRESGINIQERAEQGKPLPEEEEEKE